MVDVFYTENCNSMIKQAIETESDKKTFLMFVMMYFGIHLKLENENDEMKKQQIKILLTDFIRDPEKRKCCIEMFETKFKPVFSSGVSPSNYTFLIYNRWGEIIYESHSIDDGWDGMFDSKNSPDGTYVWSLIFQDSIQNRIHNIKGHVNLLR